MNSESNIYLSAIGKIIKAKRAIIDKREADAIRDALGVKNGMRICATVTRHDRTRTYTGPVFGLTLLDNGTVFGTIRIEPKNRPIFSSGRIRSISVTLTSPRTSFTILEDEKECKP